MIPVFAKMYFCKKTFGNHVGFGIHQLRRIRDTTCIVYIYCAGIKRVYLKGIHLLRWYKKGILKRYTSIAPV
jgi:hypothetical protein